MEIRATIEPDSQDVFLQVQQFRTLPYVAFLFTTHVMDARVKRILATQKRHDLPAMAGKDFCLLASPFWFVSQSRASRAGNWVLKGTEEEGIERNVIRSDGHRRIELLGSHSCCA